MKFYHTQPTLFAAIFIGFATFDVIFEAVLLFKHLFWLRFILWNAFRVGHALCIVSKQPQKETPFVIYFVQTTHLLCFLVKSGKMKKKKKN